MERLLLLLSSLGVNSQNPPCSGSFLQENITLEVTLNTYLDPQSALVTGGLANQHWLPSHQLPRQIFLDLAGAKIKGCQLLQL